jgi:hypothetical protein
VTEIKLLIFSDSHGSVAPMLEAVERERPDELVHLGDCLRDGEAVAFAYPALPMHQVSGNCDGWTDRPLTAQLECEGVKLLLGHGHQWRVKATQDLALAQARAVGASVLLYGHTHRAVCRREGGVLLLNPGTIGGVGAQASYGVLELTDAVPAGRIVWLTE